MVKILWGIILLAFFLIILAIVIKPAKNEALVNNQPVPVPSFSPLTSSFSLIPSNSPKPVVPVHSGRQAHIPILLYHYIGGNPNPDDSARDNLSVSPEKFDEQMGYLSQNGYDPITLDTMVAGLRGIASLPSKPVVITFDDGYVDLYINAFGILRKYGFRAVAFIPTGLIGTKYYASWEQLSEMQASGLLSFESHSVSHANLPSLTKDRLVSELAESKKTLEARFGVPINFIAYPNGISSEQVQEAVKTAGYIGGIGTWFSTTQSEGTIYNMPRIKIPGGLSLLDFAKRL
ncbi:hypothetical protein A3B42_02780 [Candidatus Daviesbacteria bacterium RIFCSPLOWO2_01_FULL_38_10]|nr:MAG: hypothetical protein A3D02_00450 [Candidatus Daviesbacteria bacterium RIFCSPHIGHO2_02_FULL_39_41]OGE39658.1 MAG: hypothetical protein A3B42_02780 [Candidatus Daviesbacteria bacterium RIFCSPLOWO2_01_FULL_38_10]OGE45352.1 MAG: hypothetical protein A3E67_02015 [Candidatus Daviesbacteria bacterium RIFCSPHIGHO2_12_FULL_38_25]HBQ50403.1 polysaccharide deacetylase [Candidatus Daviesbacteria bacterium]HCB23358.1 polysaccharide deacetylase [Candidatus Daviesbacteria bacterium]